LQEELRKAINVTIKGIELFNYILDFKDATAENIKQINLLQYVLYETLRLHSPAPGLLLRVSASSHDIGPILINNFRSISYQQR